MNLSTTPVDCYIGAFKAPLQETYLETRGFSRGMILFAIPSYGVLFKCRADGNLLDLEFGALFALLRYVKTSLASEKIKSVKVHSSNPELVFTLMNQGPGLSDRPRRAQMLKEYRSHFDIQLSLIPAIKNQTLLAPGDFCCTPEHQVPPVKPRRNGKAKVRFRPIQKGLEL